jgi:hypothetical protein
VNDIINPFGVFLGFMVPNWLARRSDVSSGAKLCYGRLMQFNGRTGRCNPREQILARELGVSERTCRRFLAQLAQHRLIKIHRHGLNRANSYQFLKHEWMTDFRADKLDRPERSESSSPVRTKLSVPLGKDSNERDSEENTPYGPPSGDDACSLNAVLLHQAEEVYAHYPKPAAREQALRSIKTAIRKFGFDHVLKRTQAYAQCVRTAEPRYIPFPAKFFRLERFNDPATTWAISASGNSKPQTVRPENYPGGVTNL